MGHVMRQSVKDRLTSPSLVHAKPIGFHSPVIVDRDKVSGAKLGSGHT
jgi:hypothetical protein